MQFNDNNASNAIEEKLRQSESLLRIAGRMARIGGWAVEMPDYSVTWSDEVCAIHEIPPGTKLTPEEAFNFYTPEYRETLSKLFMACAHEGIPFDAELEIITARNNRIWVRTIGEAERDASGAIRRVQGAFQDITERKRAAEKTHRIAERLTTTLESITDAFFTVDREWRFTYVNREAERLMQRSREVLLGRILWEDFKEAVDTTFYKEYHRAMRDGCTVAFEEFYPPLDIWIEVKAYPSKEGLAVYFRDVTQQRKSSDELRESEERFKLLSKATNDSIWDWDLITDAVWRNASFETFSGFQRDEVEQVVESWKGLIHPEDRERVLNRLQSHIDQDGEEWSDEYRLMRKDGTVVYVHDRGHVIRNSEGKAIRMIGGVTDLTERKAAEEKLAEQASLLDKASDAILVKDLEDRIVYWNKSAELLYGWRADEAIGRKASELLYKNSKRFEKARQVLFEKGDWKGETHKQSKDGRELILESRWTLMRDARGNPKSILSVSTDLTERKKLEAQFLRAQRMESIGTLAGGIAHDLNNVLAPIAMSVQLLKMQYPGESQVLDAVEAGAKRGADMVRQLLTFAKGAEGEHIPIPPSYLLDELRSMMKASFPKNVQLVVKYDSKLPALLGDATQLHQVLLNLCVNARDAMPHGGTLTVEAKNVEVDASYASSIPNAKPGDYVTLLVRDTGTGIEPEVLDRIFDPFFSTKSPDKGTGLGLSTTLGIVKGHGGFLQVSSQVGQGSTFTVYLPAAGAGGNTEVITKPEAEFRGHGETILLVDDEPAMRNIGRMVLRRLNFKPLTATDGTDGLIQVAQHGNELHAIISDLHMPHMDGLAFTRALRRMLPDVPVVVASGRMEDAVAGEFRTLGVKNRLDKPFTEAQLVETLKNLLANQRTGTPPLKR